MASEKPSPLPSCEWLAVSIYYFLFPRPPRHPTSQRPWFPMINHPVSAVWSCKLVPAWNKSPVGTQHSPGHLRQTEATLSVASPPFWSFPWVVSAVLEWFSMLEMQKCRKRHTRRVCADQDQRDPSLIPRSTKIRMNHTDHCAGDNERSDVGNFQPNSIY